MFQGGERLRISTGCRGVWGVISLLFLSPSIEIPAYLLAELNLEAGFSSGFFGSGADQGS